MRLCLPSARVGIRAGFNGLVVDPCIPGNWQGFEVRRQWRDATYNITVKNPKGVQKGVKSIQLNGKPISGSVPPQPANSVNEIIVEMG
jgi:N,N'-diacetylchitobiose phosphorylase